jgi:hypothetical protein
VGHGPALDEELAEPAGGDPVVAGVLLLGEHRLELVGVDEAVAEEQRAERRPRVMGGFHVLLIGLLAENLRHDRIRPCAQSFSGCPERP